MVTSIRDPVLVLRFELIFEDLPVFKERFDLVLFRLKNLYQSLEEFVPAFSIRRISRRFLTHPAIKNKVPIPIQEATVAEELERERERKK